MWFPPDAIHFRKSSCTEPWEVCGLANLVTQTKLGGTIDTVKKKCVESCSLNSRVNTLYTTGVGTMLFVEMNHVKTGCKHVKIL